MHQCEGDSSALRRFRYGSGSGEKTVRSMDDDGALAGSCRCVDSKVAILISLHQPFLFVAEGQAAYFSSPAFIDPTRSARGSTVCEIVLARTSTPSQLFKLATSRRRLRRPRRPLYRPARWGAGS